MDTELVVDETTPAPSRKLGSIARVPKKAAAPAPKAKKGKVVKMAEAKAAKPGKEKKAKAKTERGSRGMAGVTTGLGITAYQNQLMAKNFKAKLSDAALATLMREEFPGAIAYTEKHVAGIRSSWNSGAHGNEKPANRLSKFDDNGQPIGRGAPKPKAAAAEKAPRAKVTSVTAKKAKRKG